MNENNQFGADTRADAWLSLLDDADYESCWQTSAEYFKNGISLVEFAEKITIARNAVGQMLSRELVKSVETESAVGPSGKCLVCEYKSQFATVGEIGERLTLHLEDGDQWRVVGYYLI